MRITDCIIAKRDGKILSTKDIEHICKEYQNDNIPDYQISALLMAIYFNGLNNEELLTLTTAMTGSGRTISVPTDNFVLDKHSTGGVGDKVSLALAPILAALDFSLVKLSGRGLGHTGGTIDKFESLPNFNFNQTTSNLEHMIKECNFALLSYSKDIVPLDKKLYSLRDVTGTVQSIPLIASSIMSKKLAVQSDGIILDVKVGSGAFMKDLESAKELAYTMQKIGTNAGRKIDCVLSDMDQPLGYSVGNALELAEAVDVLQGSGPDDLKQLIFVLVGLALVQRKDITNYNDAQDIVKNIINTGKPLQLLNRFIELNGVSKNALENKTYLKKTQTIEISAEINSSIDDNQNIKYVKSIDALAVGHATMLLGAGRATKEDTIVHEVGVILHKKRGDEVHSKESLATLHYTGDTSSKTIGMAKNIISNAYTFTNNKSDVPNVPLIHHIISEK